MASSSRARQSSPLLSISKEARFRIYGHLIPQSRTIRIDESGDQRRICTPLPAASLAEQDMRRYIRPAQGQQGFGQVAYTYLASSVEQGSEDEHDFLMRICLALMNVCWTTRSEVGPCFYPLVEFKLTSPKVGRIWNWTLTPATKALIRNVHVTIFDTTFRQEVRDTAILLRSLQGFNNLDQVSIRCRTPGDHRADLDAWSNAEPHIIRQVMLIMKQCSLDSVYVSTVAGHSFWTDVRIVKSSAEKWTFEHVVPIQERYENLEKYEKAPRVVEINNCLKLMVGKEDGVDEAEILPSYKPSGNFRACLFALPVEIRTEIFSYLLLHHPAKVDLCNGSPNRDRLNSFPDGKIETEEKKVRRIPHHVRHHNGKRIAYAPIPRQLPRGRSLKAHRLRYLIRRRKHALDTPLWQRWIWPTILIHPQNQGSEMTRVIVNDCLALVTTCKKFRQELLARLYSLLEFNFAINTKSTRLASVWNWTLTPETRSSIRSIVVEMPYQAGLKKDSESIQRSLKGMSGLKEVVFTGVFERVFTPVRYTRYRPPPRVAGVRARIIRSPENVEEEMVLWRPHGLSKCVTVLDECKTLTKCLISGYRTSQDMMQISIAISERLRIVSDDTPVTEDETEVDVRSAYEAWRSSLRGTRMKRVADPGIRYPSDRAEYHELSERDIRAKRRRLLKEQPNSIGGE